ncbi:protein mono-ADP-ribosyltransferase PARP12-like [Erythrolamprus reginae]|uniref:protein mono-ADP-ribosyltransferase PARP12-like n=1 Tax=Erythrolamprus reginae TaxID=121349 RepID=UPI00396CAEEE
MTEGCTLEDFDPLLQDETKFTLEARTEDLLSAAGGEEHRIVVATTGARLCQDQSKGKCDGGCRRLHLCRYFVYGGCREQAARRPCKFIHDINTDHNLSVLKEHGIHGLNVQELNELLLQNDPSLLPEICPYYNKGDGPYGSCTFKNFCVKLHMCQYYLQGECRFWINCKRCHDIFNPDCYEKLEKWGMSHDLISKIPLFYRNVYDIKNNTSSKYRERRENQIDSTTDIDESDIICLYHISKSCNFQDKCTRVHYHLPYRWQVLSGALWKDIDNMQKIEKAFCDPGIESTFHLGGPDLENINFSNMTWGSAKIRRLSTPSSVTKPPHYILTTDWIWYWKDEYNVWKEYGVKDGDHTAAHTATTVTSFVLEKAYQSKSVTTLKFSAGTENYEIDIKAMKQKNLKYQTERCVCRRPWFVSKEDVEEKKKSKMEQSKGSRSHIPRHWNPTALPKLRYKDGYHTTATMASFDFEKPYQSKSVTTLKFSAATQNYETFKARKEKRMECQPKRHACKRTRFVSKEDAEKKKKRKVKKSKRNREKIPSHWDPTALPELGYKLINLLPSSSEYIKVQTNFQRTMPRVPISAIKRIQNSSLWEVYQWQKEQMKKANGGKDVDERLLFHGTSNNHVDAICQQNFDWRICGVHGTAYGKGSYFARDAAYSDDYSRGASFSVKSMFLAKVLVGDFTTGSPLYLRPPSKDNQSSLFYNSCVDYLTDPSIFVIFEKHQIYPEYLIEYKN